jgi:putative membrane protein
MIKYLSLFFKGIAMGAANVIPGVSGGTIALITGIFDKLIASIKSFDLVALKLFFTGRWKELASHINLTFLIVVFSGIAVSILTLAQLFDFLFDSYPIYIWSYFFGLILASVYFVGKTIEKWNLAVVVSILIGTIAALSVSVLSPASENSSIFYLFICGVVAACSMILPGLSGSFVLILLGNYQLVMIDSINSLDLSVLIPVAIGAVAGLVVFSHFLSWVFKNYKNQTIGLLSGFIIGSLGILWPWKSEVYKIDADGGFLVKKSGEKIVEGYEWFIPDTFSTEVVYAILLILTGIVSIYIMERVVESKES